MAMILLTIQSCAGKVDKSFKVDIVCRNCKTPYGTGEEINLKIERDISVGKDK